MLDTRVKIHVWKMVIPCNPFNKDDLYSGHVALETFCGEDKYQTKLERSIDEQKGVYVSFNPEGNPQPVDLEKTFKVTYHSLKYDRGKAEKNNRQEEVFTIYGLDAIQITEAYNNFRENGNNRWAILGGLLEKLLHIRHPFINSPNTQNCSGLVSALLYIGGIEKYFSPWESPWKGAKIGFSAGICGMSIISGTSLLYRFIDTIQNEYRRKNLPEGLDTTTGLIVTWLIALIGVLPTIYKNYFPSNRLHSFFAATAGGAVIGFGCGLLKITNGIATTPNDVFTIAKTAEESALNKKEKQKISLNNNDDYNNSNRHLCTIF